MSTTGDRDAAGDDAPGGEPTSISRLGTNTLANKLVTYTVGLPASVAIAHALGPSGRGGYQIPVTLATVVTMVASLGIVQSQFRAWARDHYTPDAFVTAAAVCAVGTSVLGLGLTALAFAIGRDAFLGGATTTAVVLAAVSIPFQIHASYGMVLLTLAGRMPRSNLAVTLGTLLQTGAILVWYLLGRLTVVNVLGFYVAGMALQWAVITTGLSRVAKIRLRALPRGLIRRLVADGVAMQPFVLFQFLNLRMDVFLVARYEGARGVGIYTAGALIAELVWTVSDSVGYSLIERQGNAPADEAYSVTFIGARMSVLVVVIVGVPLLVVSPLLVTVLFGGAFRGAVPVVAVLLPASAAMAIWRACSLALSRFARTWLQSAIALVSLAVNVAVNVFAIPAFGVVGAALASVISYGLAAALVAWWISRASGTAVSALAPRRDDIARLRGYGRELATSVGARLRPVR